MALITGPGSRGLSLNLRTLIGLLTPHFLTRERGVPQPNADLRVRVVTGTGSLAGTDRVVVLDATLGDFTFFLPLAAQRPGREVKIVRISHQGVPTVATADGDSICGQESVALLIRGESLDLVSDGQQDWLG